MGSLRARLSSTEMDRAILGHTYDASKSIKEALRVAREAADKETGPSSRRARKVERELSRILRALESTGRIGNPYTVSDNDLIPDSERPLPPWVEARNIERKAARRARGGDK